MLSILGWTFLFIIFFYFLSCVYCPKKNKKRSDCSPYYTQSNIRAQVVSCCKNSLSCALVYSQTYIHRHVQARICWWKMYTNSGSTYGNQVKHTTLHGLAGLYSIEPQYYTQWKAQVGKLPRGERGCSMPSLALRLGKLPKSWDSPKIFL